MQFTTLAALSSRVSGVVRLPVAILAISAALTSGTIAGPMPREAGVWIDDSGDGAVNIAPCGAALCGRIVWLKDLMNDQGEPKHDRFNPDASKHARPICGLQVIGQLKPVEAGGFDEGWVYDPKEGKSYSVAIALAGADRLQVTGYLGVKLLGKTMQWTRAKTQLPSCEPAAAAPPVDKTEVKPTAKPASVAAPAAAAVVKAAVPVKDTVQPPVAKPSAVKSDANEIRNAASPKAKPVAAAVDDGSGPPTTVATKKMSVPKAKPPVDASTNKAATASAKTGKTAEKAGKAEVLPWSEKTPAQPAATKKAPDGAANLGASNVRPSVKQEAKSAAKPWPQLDVYSAAP